MRTLLGTAACLAALTINSPARAASANVSLATSGTPEGFSELASERTILVDVYFGERKVGETLVDTAPGTLRFKAPGEVASMLPAVIVSDRLERALSGALSTNAGRACSPSSAADCGTLEPDVAGIIFDEDRFRVDLFVHPDFLETVPAHERGYLPEPEFRPSLTNAMGLALSGTLGERTDYNVQNRTIFALGPGRIRANSSVTSTFGLVVDDLVAEVDRKSMRYSGGLFWAPGNEFTGQRRILGLGLGTQFDTALDRETLHGTPLILILPRPSRVEILIDGRLVSARSYAAGSTELDTAGLPDGSYSVLLRIEEANGSVRQERRFFVKQTQVPPAGRPIVYAYAGVLANTRDGAPVSLSRTLYYQAGTAWRLGNGFALDAAVVGTQEKLIVESGGWLLRGPVRMRAAGLLSTAGDRGALVQLMTSGAGPFSLSFDLRRIWSGDGGPLIPLSSPVETFDGTQPSGVQLAAGSYTQGTASLGLRLGGAFLSVVGSYRRDRDFPADYSIGPSINWPIISRNQLQVVLEGSAQRTRTTTAGFVGARILYSSGGMSMLSSVGRGFERTRLGPGPSGSRMVSNLSAQYSHQTDRALMNFEGGYERALRSSTLRGGATVDSSFGNLRADVLHGLEGASGTQYSLSFQSGLALGGEGLNWAGRELDQSALLVSVSGDARDALFDVLVDEARRGQVRTGQRFSMFVPAYRTYRVRLVPAADAAVRFDSVARDVTVYPGNVQALAWRAETVFALFAQAVRADGSPIANALVKAGKGIAVTDEQGYFQIEARNGEELHVERRGEGACRVALGPVTVRNGLSSPGKVTCQ